MHNISKIVSQPYINYNSFCRDKHKALLESISEVNEWESERVNSAYRI